MEEDRGLLELAHRLVTDKGFRAQVMMAPRETLTKELGISREAFDALRALAPVLLAGSLVLLVDPSGAVRPEWGGWGRP